MTRARSLERHLAASMPEGGYSVAPLVGDDLARWRAVMVEHRVALGFMPRTAPLLTPPANNPKLKKSGTYGLSLAAASLSGAWNVCRYSTAGCRGVCLESAGKGGLAAVQLGRVWKTRLLGAEPELFIRALADEIRRAVDRRPLDSLGRRHGRVPIRLNVLSDLPWERFAPALFLIPATRYYDYTKNGTRAASLPANYHLTFSASERTADADLVAAAGIYGTVAVVFSTRRGRPLPASYAGLPVVDADLSDSRWKDPVGTISGLRAKGAAVGDSGGGFVRLVA